MYLISPTDLFELFLLSLEVADTFLDRFVLSHAKNNISKLHTCYMILHKLYSLKLGLCKPDSADALSMQEILMPGHLLNAFMKEKMQEALASIPGTFLYTYILVWPF